MHDFHAPSMTHHPANAAYQRSHAQTKIKTSMMCSAFTHLTFFTAVFLMWVYVWNYDNPVAAKISAHKFNWHPALMVSAFVLFMGEALISYRILPFDHLTQKLIHMLLQSLALATSTVGLYMIISYHEEQKPPIDNFYNIHGIVGLTAYILFVLQYFMGLTTMVWPRLADGPRAAALPYHKYIGVVVFLLVWLAMISGIMDRQRINAPVNYSPPMRVANAAGMFIVLSGAVIVYHFSAAGKEKEQEAAAAQRLLP